ncbi:hypothetical protein D3C86_1837690 [compost metagenome]
MMTFEPIDNPESMQVNHKDFNTMNNHISNLEWTTNQENVDHFHNSGRKVDATKTTGENHHLSVMTESKVIELREMYLTGKYSNYKLAQLFNTTESNVRAIVKRKTWKHI